MSNYIVIDGIEYPVGITELQRKADILDKYAHRDENGVLHREPIGTYHNYSLKIYVRPTEYDLYNRLFDVLSEPVASHMVELPHDHIRFEGYFSSVQDSIKRINPDGTVRYTGLQCNLIAIKPRRTASGN